VELPFRVLIATIVVGLTGPTALAGFSAYEGVQLSNRAVAAVDAIVRVAQQFFLSGGGAEDVPVDLLGGITARLEYARIGDVVDGPLGPSARFRISGQPETFLLADPPVPMTAGDGPLELPPGRHVVRVEYEGDGPVRLAVVG
jgi:hypothetical protein